MKYPLNYRNFMKTFCGLTGSNGLSLGKWNGKYDEAIDSDKERINRQLSLISILFTER